MSEHKATITWVRQGPDFLRGQYSREHTWTFDGGFAVPASPSPSGVPAPYSNPANVDPEEAFVAAISSCHMLTFLFLASRQGFQVESYRDDAVGVMRAQKGAIQPHTLPREQLDDALVHPLQAFDRHLSLGGGRLV